MTLRRREGAGDPRTRVASPFRIIALDPGGTTGVAYAEWLQLDNSPLTSLDQIRFDAYQLGHGEHHLMLWRQLCDLYPFPGFETETGLPLLEVVCESFEFRQHINKVHAKTKVELISKEYIGVINLFCQVHNLIPTYRNASTAKTFVPDKKIKQLYLWKPGMPHAMDAMRHLLRYMVVDKKIRSPITDRWLQG